MDKTILSKSQEYVIYEEAKPTVFLIGFLETHEAIKQALINDKRR